MTISFALAAAQQRLLRLREQQHSHSAETPPPHTDWLRVVEERLQAQRDHASAPSTIEEAAAIEEAAVEAAPLSITVTVLPPIAASPETIEVKNVAIAPDVAMAMLRTEQAAAGRIWWLLRGIDQVGRGAITVAEARARLATKGAAWRVCGWRQLRNLLRAGDGLFWERRDGMIWLRSLAKVAVALDVERFSAEPVSVPVKDLFGSIGDVRATLYACFHSARTGAPIARETLRAIGGVCAASQINYERRRQITATTQFALVHGDVETMAIAHGQAIFQIEDTQGKFGRAGARLLVRQLPNCFAGTYTPMQGRQKRRLNRRLTDLLNLGTAGNGFTRFERVFWDDSVGAVRAGRDCLVRERGKWWFALAPSRNGMA